MPKAKKPGNLFVISGPSGVGKDTLVAQVFKRVPGLVESVSVTSRRPRQGEEDGIHYYFQTKDSVQSMIANDELLEWNEYAGNFYGTPKSFVREHLQAGDDILFVVDVNGAANIRREFPQVKLIFIEPPSLHELEKRLVNRATESKEQIVKRLHQVEAELEQKDNFDKVIVNDTIDAATDEIARYILSFR